VEGRNKLRVFLAAPIRYRVFERPLEATTGVGEAISISRSGMQLRVKHRLSIGDRVAVTVDLLEGADAGCAELTLLGQVVRVDSDTVALRFDDSGAEADGAGSASVSSKR